MTADLATTWGWPAILVPAAVAPDRFAQPVSALSVYQRVTWSKPPAHLGSVRFEATEAWAASAGDGIEIGLTSVASGPSGTHATGLLVVRRDAAAIPMHGTPGTPDRPDPTDLQFVKHIVVSESEVGSYVAGLGERYAPLGVSSVAWGRGYPNVLVPGGLLLASAHHRRLQAPAGGVEAWFLEPVPAGALLELWESAQGRAGELRLVGRPHAAVVLRWDAAPPSGQPEAAG